MGVVLSVEQMWYAVIIYLSSKRNKTHFLEDHFRKFYMIFFLVNSMIIFWTNSSEFLYFCYLFLDFSIMIK